MRRFAENFWSHRNIIPDLTPDPAVRAANRRGLSLKAWLCEAIDAKLKREAAMIYDWNSIDWTKKNCVIAQELGCHVTTVSIRRKELANKTLRSRRENIDWEKINWSRTTDDLAKSLGVWKPLVSAARRKFAPDTVRNYQAVDWGKTDSAIAKSLKVSIETVRQNRELQAIDAKLEQEE